MSKVRFGFVVRNLIVAFLLSGMAIGLTACPEGTVAYQTRDGAGNRSGGSSY